MSIKPIAQLGAEVSTVIAIKIGAKDTATEQGRAAMAVKVANIFQVASTGDTTTALGDLSALILTPNQDPGVTKVAQDLMAYGAPFLQAEASVLQSTLAGLTAEQVLAQIAAGMTAVATVYAPK